MCSVFIIYRRADSRNTAAINFFVKYPLSVGRTRRTDEKRPADRCGQGGKSRRYRFPAQLCSHAGNG